MKARIALAVVASMALGQFTFADAAKPAPLDAALDASRAYLLEHARELGVSGGDVDELRMTGGHVATHTGTRYLYLQQQVRGIDVMTGDVTMALSPTNAVAHVGSRLLANVDARISGSAKLDAVAAVRAAAAQLGLHPDASLTVVGARDGIIPATLISGAGISQTPIPARLVYQPVGTRLRLGWEVEIQELSDQHWWKVVVDAETGAMIDRFDLVVHEQRNDFSQLASSTSGARERITAPAGQFPATDGAAYRVYAWPIENPNEGDRTLVTNVADPDASPYGWHDIDGAPGAEYTRTRGNNVHAYTDHTGATNLEAQGELSPDGGESLVFDNPIDLSLPPITYREAAITNLFYWNNVIHDVFDGYGFNGAAGNFEENSYPDGDPETWDGYGSDYVYAEAQDGGGTDNANFATPRDGSNPRMQMYNWLATGKRQVRDGDLDAGIVTHEYGHGISTRLTGGPMNVDSLRNAEQGGEGWSDFFSIWITARADEATKRRGLATYSVGQDSRTQTGLRPAPYHTLNPNPKYDAIKTAAVPHGVGWVWASMLWEMHWGLVADGRNSVNDAPLGFNPDLYAPWNTGGNNLAMQLVIDGLKLQPTSPGFVDARNAILKADDLLTGVDDDPETEVNETIGSGANRCVIWRAFAKRGLGVSASQGSTNSVTDGVQAFDVPEGC